ncbi:MAG: ribokinase [Pseudomonadota bacterium]
MLLVFGSLNVDLVFEVEALPGPGETVVTGCFARLAGGKGANQARAAARAGGRVRMAGAVGSDQLAAIATAGLEAAGVDLSLVRCVAAPTGIAVIGVDRNGENSIIVASGANAQASDRAVDAEQLAAAGTLLLQNEVPLDASTALALRAGAAKVRVVWNLAPACRPEARALDAVDVLVVNRGELDRVAGDRGDLVARARHLARQHGLAVVVTLGGAGALVVEAETATRLPPLAVDVVDTTGAGDAFVGVLAASLDAGLPLVEAARRATVAAALTCTALGAQSAQPDATAIDAGLGRLGPPGPLTLSRAF